MEQVLMDVLANAAWQIPLLAAAAWVFLRLGKFGPQTQHCVWLAVLGLAVGLPWLAVRADLPSAASASCTACSVQPVMPARVNASAPALAENSSGAMVSPWLQRITALRRPTLRLSATATAWLAGFYLATFLFGLYRIISAWREARRLVHDARVAVLQPRWRTMFEDCGRRLRTRLPQLRTSSEVQSPVVVGVLHPVLLLPENFGDHSQDEVQAALYHELAHVRRHDYLCNMICRMAALPIVWHPVTYGVQQRIRRTREMVCDQLAAREMRSRVGYAKCLLTMAQRTLGRRDPADSAQAIGLFGDNMLEERIMRLMKSKNKMTMRMKLIRFASGAAVMIAAAALATLLHVTPTLAQATGNVVTAPAPPAPPAAPRLPAARMESIPPMPSVAPAPPVVSVASAAPLPLAAPVAPPPPAAPVASKPAPIQGSARKDKNDPADRHPKNKPQNESFVIDGYEPHGLTAAQQARLRQEMDAMRAQIAAATKRVDSPELQKQIADLEKQQIARQRLDTAKIQQQVNDAVAKMNSPEFQQQMENLQKQLANRDMQRRMAVANRELQAVEAQVWQQANLKTLDMSKIQQQIDAATAKINSPELQRQIENLQKQIASGDMQRCMEQAVQAMKETESRINKAPTK